LSQLINLLVQDSSYLFFVLWFDGRRDEGGVQERQKDVRLGRGSFLLLPKKQLRLGSVEGLFVSFPGCVCFVKGREDIKIRISLLNSQLAALRLLVFFPLFLLFCRSVVLYPDDLCEV